MEYIFSPDNWEWLWSGNNLRFLLEGFLVNLEIAAIGIVFSMIFGLLLALMRVATSRLLSIPAGIWVDLWRNLPLILIILYLSLVVPSSWRQAWGDNVPGWFPEALQDELVLGAILGLVLYNSAVLCEIMRSGILSLDRGQREAAASLGLTYRQQMRFVVLPQGLRRMVPATVSQLITLIKDTTLITIIAIPEVLGAVSSLVGSSSFGSDGPRVGILQAFLVVGFLFFVVNFSLSRLSRRLEIRERERTGTTLKRVEGLEDQVALETDVTGR